jgi:hypothetical protein
MPSPRCSFNVNGALSFVPSTWKPEGALACGFEAAGVAGRGTETAALGRVVAGALGLLLASVLDLGGVAVFGLVLAAGLDLAFRDGDLVRLTGPLPDLVFAVPLVFAAALAFTDFALSLATMRAPFAPNDSRPCRVATPTAKPQLRSMDRRELATEIYPQGLYHTPNNSEDPVAPASVRPGRGA